MDPVAEGQLELTDPHGFFARRDGACCFCGGRGSLEVHDTVILDATAETVYHDLAQSVRFDGDRPTRHDGTLLNYAVSVADTFAEVYGLERFDSPRYSQIGEA